MGAAVPAIVAVTALVGAGAAAYSATRKVDTPDVKKPPAVPQFDDLPGEKQEREKQRRAGSGRSSTLLTTPSSLGEANIFKPTLLGQ